MSKIGVQVVPALVVFHTLPEEAATYQVLRSVGSTAMSAMRPEATAGPMLRQRREERRPEVSSGGPSSSSSWAWRGVGEGGRSAARVKSAKGLDRRRACMVGPDGVGMGWVTLEFTVDPTAFAS